jgi:hypothetical protein
MVARAIAVSSDGKLKAKPENRGARQIQHYALLLCFWDGPQSLRIGGGTRIGLWTLDFTNRDVRRLKSLPMNYCQLNQRLRWPRFSYLTSTGESGARSVPIYRIASI